jgi:hypothetical protein
MVQRQQLIVAAILRVAERHLLKEIPEKFKEEKKKERNPNYIQ